MSVKMLIYNVLQIYMMFITWTLSVEEKLSGKAVSVAADGVKDVNVSL